MFSPPCYICVVCVCVWWERDSVYGPPCLSGVITKMNIVIIRMNKVWLWRWIRRLGLLSLLLGRLFIRREKVSACNMREPITFSSRGDFTHICACTWECCNALTPDQRRPFVFICAVKWPMYAIYLFPLAVRGHNPVYVFDPKGRRHTWLRLQVAVWS